MSTLDLVVIVVYLLGIAALGWWAGRRRASESVEDFFLGGRRLPWWMLGTSMAATTLAADTPLTVAGITIEQGIAGNWFWWSFAASHVLVAVVLGPLWRRADVVTDAELCELRYGGRPAAVLRGLKAFWLAVPINCFAMGWVIRAMLEVAAVVLPDVSAPTVVAALLGLTLLYSIRSGFDAVVATDLVQLPIALGSAILLGWLAVDAAGGMGPIIVAAREAIGPDAVALVGFGSESLGWDLAAVFFGVQWWAWKNADGGGIFVQRLLAARDEGHALLGGVWFAFVHYVLRPWPWIVTGLAALVVVPEVAANHPERAYPAMLMAVLPDGLRGLLIAGFLAAFMSTIDTHLNWGASYVAHDLLGRFVEVPPRYRPLVSRGAVGVMGALALVAAWSIESIRGAWEIAVAFGSGAGAVALLRWFWWRVTAWSEISALLASGVFTVATWTLGGDLPWSVRLCTVTFGAMAVWLPVTLFGPRDPEAAARFCARVRPPGPGWTAVAARTPPPLAPLVVRWLAALALVLSMMLGVGAWLFA